MIIKSWHSRYMPSIFFLIKPSILKEDENIIYKTPSRWWSHYSHQIFPKSFRPDASQAFLGTNLTLTVFAAEILSPLDFLFLLGSLATTEPLSVAFACGLLIVCCCFCPLATWLFFVEHNVFSTTVRIRTYHCKSFHFSYFSCFVKQAFYWLPNSENGSLECLKYKIGNLISIWLISHDYKILQDIAIFFSVLSFASPNLRFFFKSSIPTAHI